jgi:hypothetical protein
MKLKQKLLKIKSNYPISWTDIKNRSRGNYVRALESVIISWAPVVHACNPSYSGGRDQEVAVQGQHRQKVQETLSQKTLHKNRADAVTQDKGHQYHQKKKMCNNYITGIQKEK